MAKAQEMLHLVGIVDPERRVNATRTNIQGTDRGERFFLAKEVGNYGRIFTQERLFSGLGPIDIQDSQSV